MTKGEMLDTFTRGMFISEKFNEHLMLVHFPMEHNGVGYFATVIFMDGIQQGVSLLTRELEHDQRLGMISLVTASTNGAIDVYDAIMEAADGAVTMLKKSMDAAEICDIGKAITFKPSAKYLFIGHQGFYDLSELEPTRMM